MQSLDCPFCRRTFYKLEHLKRHERSHTGSRPFVCSVCNRAFGRQDSLHRHRRLHTREGEQQEDESPVSNQTVSSTTKGASNTPGRHGHGVPPRSTTMSDERDMAQTEQPVDPQLQSESAQMDYGLMWPDTEGLLQTLISSGTTQQSINFEPYGSPSTPQTYPIRFGDQPRSVENIPQGANDQVVSGLSNLIQLQSSSVTSAANLNISSIFLDECLHLFFIRFIPTFPVLHRPTFVFRECLQPLLLNAVAIGSLYSGHANAVEKGEALWRLAHTALATTWQDMISHRGPYDDRPGVQLLTASLLGQIYGLLSKSKNIRMTSQAFHVLAFSWAKQCGISGHDTPPSEPTNPPVHGTEEAKQEFWHRWVARGIQQRAMLAHYALDGLISRMMGTSTSARHLSNRLIPSGDDSAFTAQTADEFMVALQINQTQAPTLSFRSTFSQMLSPGNQANLPRHILSPFNVMVLHEGLQSFLSDTEDERMGPNYRERAPLMNHALMSVYEATMFASEDKLTNHEKLEATLRWHALCIEAIINTSKLCRVICRTHHIEQDLWMQDDSANLDLDLSQWPRTCDGRRALLHAVAIQGIIEELPRGRAHAIHMPSSLFAAATISAAFCLAGVMTVNLPSTVSWIDVVIFNPSIETDHTSSPTSANQAILSTRKFILGQSDQTTAAYGAYRNLPYEFNSMQKLFGCLATQWGVAGEMAKVVRQWAGRFH